MIKKKKFLCIIVIITIILAVLGLLIFIIIPQSVGSLSPEPHDSPDKDVISVHYDYTEQITTEADWSKAYSDYLFDLINSDEFDVNYTFGLFYIDKDDVPELVISTAHFHFSSSYIVSYYNENLCVSDSIGSYGCFALAEHTGICIGNYYGQGASEYSIFQFDAGVLTELSFVAKYLDIPSSSDILSFRYEINNNDATEDEYNTIMKQYTLNTFILTGSSFYTDDFFEADYDDLSMHALNTENVNLYLGI